MTCAGSGWRWRACCPSRSIARRRWPKLMASLLPSASPSPSSSTKPSRYQHTRCVELLSGFVLRSERARCRQSGELVDVVWPREAVPKCANCAKVCRNTCKQHERSIAVNLLLSCVSSYQAQTGLCFDDQHAPHHMVVVSLSRSQQSRLSSLQIAVTLASIVLLSNSLSLNLTFPPCNSLVHQCRPPTLTREHTSCDLINQMTGHGVENALGPHSAEPTETTQISPASTAK